MIKLVCFVTRDPALSVGEFHDHWRNVHGPLIAANPAARVHLLRYEQNHRKPRDYERADVPYDGVAIQWYDSWDGFLEMLADARYRETVGADERQLLDFDRLVLLFTEPEEEIIAGPTTRPAGLTKLVCAVKRNPAMPLDEFYRYWRERHGPLNRDTPEIAKYLIRYEQNHRLASDYSRDDCPFDGVTVEWFRSARDLFAMAADPAYAALVYPDEERFLDRDGLLYLLTEPEETIVG